MTEWDRWGEAQIAFGSLKVSVRFDAENEEQSTSEKRKLTLLTRLLQGMADAAEMGDIDALTMYAKLVNGPKVDEVLDREALKKRPCGCKGKD